MECGRSQQTGHREVASSLLALCPAQVVSHEYGEGAMCRYCSEHPRQCGSKSSLAYVQDVFQGGKTHSDHHGVDNAIKGFVKVRIIVKHAADEHELAGFLYQCNQEKSVNGLPGKIFFLGGYKNLEGKTDHQRHHHSDHPKNKTLRQQAQGLGLMPVFKVDVKDDAGCGSRGNRQQG